jgi:hypothetical protein
MASKRQADTSHRAKITDATPPRKRAVDTVAAIMQYESGELGDDGVIELFQQLLDDGTVWRLQGHYGRTAHQLIAAGLITPPTTRNERTDGASAREPWQVDAAIRRDDR